MKITKSQLKQIIKEEYNALQTEAGRSEAGRFERNRRRAREDAGRDLGPSSSPISFDKPAMEKLKPVYNAVRERIFAEQLSGPNRQITPEALPVWRIVSTMTPHSKILQYPELISAMEDYAKEQIEIEELAAAIPSGMKL